MFFKKKKPSTDVIASQDRVISTLRKTVSELETEKEVLKNELDAAIEDRQHDLFKISEILESGKQWKVVKKEVINYVTLAASYLDIKKEEPEK